MSYIRYVEELDLLNITSEPTEYINQNETIDYLPIYISVSCIISLIICCCCYYQRRRRA
jgi:hypothetical protein